MNTIIAASSPFLDSLQHITGFLIVVFALVILWGVTSFIGWIFLGRTEAAAASSTPDAKTPANQVASQEEEEIPEEVVVAITAAITCILGTRHRIVSIRSGNRDWSREGRREHFASHRLR